jgi:uncharacterized protein
MDAALSELRERLRGELSTYGRLLVAYSGGVDSAYLAWEAHEVLGEGMLAAIADSPSIARKELAAAIHFANSHNIPLRVLKTAEMDRPEYTKNDASRCYFCKDELFRSMERLSGELGIAAIAYGRNLDDSGDFRPGQRAAALHHAVAPLAAAGLGKDDIRSLARAAGLDVWDKPASACLASRLEYGRPVTAEALRQIEQAEDGLSSLGLRQFRVRHHGPLARVEISREELPAILSLAWLDQIAGAVRAAGFQYAALDCEGYRSGSMNAVLPIEVLTAAR